MQIEPLESRIAPASVLSYIDVDGDSVKILSSLGDLQAPGVVTKTPGSFTGEQVTLLDLRDPSFQGTTITTVVQRAPGGDGLVHLGHIDATGRDLAKVIIKGDLAAIDAGDANTAANSPAIKLLSVRSMGHYGLVTQGGAGDLASDFVGSVRVIKVTGDLVGATLFATGGADGKIGSVAIGGSIVTDTTGAGGVIRSSGDLGKVTIRGDVIGGSGAGSAMIQSESGSIGSMAIGGSLVGGMGDESGKIDAGAKITSITIRGDIIGGAGKYNTLTFPHLGQISAGDVIGSVQVGRSVQGGAGLDSAEIRAGVMIGSIKIGGSLVASDADFSAQISGGSQLGPVKIGGSIIGGGGQQSAFVTGTTVGSVTVGGMVVGGAGHFSGAIFSGGSILGSVKIGGDLRGGSGDESAQIGSNNVVGNVTIGGSVLGGTGVGSGAIEAINNDLGAVRVGGNLIGGSISGSAGNLNFTGVIESGGRIKSVFIGGSVIAGTDTSTSGELFANGAIRADDDIGPIVIKGSLIGNEVGGLHPVIISARGQATLAPNATADVAIKSVTIGGRVSLAKILGGFDTNDADNAGSNGNASIGPVKIGGDWYASSISAGINAGSLGFGNAGTVINTPVGAATDAIVARIASITIKGDVTGAPSPFFQTGFTAQQIGSFRAGAFIARLTTATDPAISLTPYNINVNIFEV